MKRNLALVGALVLLTGCAILYGSTVTITSVVDSAMKQWASLSVAGKTSAAIDLKVIQAHDDYRKACGALQATLIVYKESGDQEVYLQAFVTAKAAADNLINLIVPLVAPAQGATLKSNLAKANSI